MTSFFFQFSIPPLKQNERHWRSSEKTEKDDSPCMDQAGSRADALNFPFKFSQFLSDS